MLDPSLFVPPNFPEVANLRSEGCSKKAFRYPRVDHTQEFFCKKWNPKSFPCICPVSLPAVVSPPSSCPPRGMGKEMESLDYFTALPIRPEGKFQSVMEPLTLGQRMGVIPIPKNQPRRKLEFSPVCDCELNRLPSNDKRISNPCENDQQVFDISPDLPFRVCFPDTFEKSKIRIRTGTERCLQPSRYREMTTVYREGFGDIMKTKTPKQLALYKTPLTIDNRRARVVTSCNMDPNLIISTTGCPLTFNARYTKMKMCPSKKRQGLPCIEQKPEFEVILPPGPIVIPTDYCY